MFRKITATAALVGFLAASPVMAQDEPEEPRTTYQVTMLDIAPGKEDRYVEILDKYGAAAAKATGSSAPVVHWIMAGSDYDLMIVTEMKNGMASFDSHNSPDRAAFMKALLDVAGSEEELEKVTQERRDLVVKSTSIYTHTHP